MPHLFRKKNKSYGVTSRDGSQTRTTVRPLSATFGNNIQHLDEEEAGKKKSRGRDRTSKSRGARATSVPPRPVPAPFAPVQGQASNVKVKRSQSPDIIRKRPSSSSSSQRKSTDMYANITSDVEDGFAPKTATIRYADDSLTPAGNWNGSAGDVSKAEPGMASSEEDLTYTPFQRDPSLRVQTNSYHNQRSFKSFHSEDASQNQSVFYNPTAPTQKPDKSSHFATPYNGNLTAQSHFKESMDTTDFHTPPVRITHQRQISNSSDTSSNRPPPPRRSSSLFFEEVAIPTKIEQYHVVKSSSDLQDGEQGRGDGQKFDKKRKTSNSRVDAGNVKLVENSVAETSNRSVEPKTDHVKPHGAGRNTAEVSSTQATFTIGQNQGEDIVEISKEEPSIQATPVRKKSVQFGSSEVIADNAVIYDDDDYDTDEWSESTTPRDDLSNHSDKSTPRDQQLDDEINVVSHDDPTNVKTDINKTYDVYNGNEEINSHHNGGVQEDENLEDNFDFVQSLLSKQLPDDSQILSGEHNSKLEIMDTEYTKTTALVNSVKTNGDTRDQRCDVKPEESFQESPGTGDKSSAFDNKEVQEVNSFDSTSRSDSDTHKVEPIDALTSNNGQNTDTSHLGNAPRGDDVITTEHTTLYSAQSVTVVSGVLESPSPNVESNPKSAESSILPQNPGVHEKPTALNHTKFHKPGGSSLFVSNMVRSLNARSLQETEHQTVPIVRQASGDKPQGAEKSIEPPSVEMRKHTTGASPQADASAARSFVSPAIKRRSLNFETAHTGKSSSNSLTAGKADVTKSKSISMEGLDSNPKPHPDQEVRCQLGDVATKPPISAKRPFVPNKPVKLSAFRTLSVPAGGQVTSDTSNAVQIGNRRISGLLSPKPFQLDTSKLAPASKKIETKSDSSTINNISRDTNTQNTKLPWQQKSSFAKPVTPVKPLLTPVSPGMTRSKSVGASNSPLDMTQTNGGSVAMVLDPETMPKVSRQLPRTPDAALHKSDANGLEATDSGTESQNVNDVSFLDSLKSTTKALGKKEVLVGSAPSHNVPWRATYQPNSTQKGQTHNDHFTKKNDLSQFLDGLKRRESVKRKPPEEPAQPEVVDAPGSNEKTVAERHQTDSNDHKSPNVESQNGDMTKEDSVDADDDGGHNFANLRNIDKRTQRNNSISHLKSPRQRKQYRTRKLSENSTDQEGCENGSVISNSDHPLSRSSSRGHVSRSNSHGQDSLRSNKDTEDVESNKHEKPRESEIVKKSSDGETSQAEPNARYDGEEGSGVVVVKTIVDTTKAGAEGAPWTPTAPPRKSRRRKQDAEEVQEVPPLKISTIPSDVSGPEGDPSGSGAEKSACREEVGTATAVLHKAPYVSRMWEAGLPPTDKPHIRPSYSRTLPPKREPRQPTGIEKIEVSIPQEKTPDVESKGDGEVSEFKNVDFEPIASPNFESFTPPDVYQDDLDDAAESDLPRGETDHGPVSTEAMLAALDIPPPRLDSPTPSDIESLDSSRNETKSKNETVVLSEYGINLEMLEPPGDLDVDDMELSEIIAKADIRAEEETEEMSQLQNENESDGKPQEPSPDVELGETSFKRAAPVERSRPQRASPVYKGRAAKYDFISSPVPQRPDIVPRLDLSAVTDAESGEFEERAIDVQDLEGTDDAYSERGIDVPARGVLHKRHSASSGGEDHTQGHVKGQIRVTKVPRKTPKSPRSPEQLGMGSSSTAFSRPKTRHFSPPVSSPRDRSNKQDVNAGDKKLSPRGKPLSPKQFVEKKPTAKLKSAARRNSEHSTVEDKSVKSDQSKSVKSDESHKSSQSKNSTGSASKQAPTKSTIPQPNIVDIPRSVDTQDISIDLDNGGDLLEMKLPGLKLKRGTVTGRIGGSEYLHPVLERSLRNPTVPQRGPDFGGNALLLDKSSTDMAVLVEDDYITPRPGYHHGNSASTEIPEPWELSMTHSWNTANPQFQSKEDEYVLNRQNSVLSHVTDSTVAGSPWQQKPVELWDSEDVSDWLEQRKLENLAGCLGGTTLSGRDLLQLNEASLISLGLADMAERAKILEQLRELQEKPKSSAQFWTLKQASVRRKNLEASNDALKSHLSSLQQLNQRQGQQIKSYLQEMKDQQKEAELLLHSPPASQHCTNSESQSAATAPSRVQRQSSMSTEISAYLPPLSLTESELSPRSLPLKALTEWDTTDVLQWLAAVDLGRLSSQFYSHRVTGKDLTEISIEFFDRINVTSLEDRELLLSKLYELQHPGEPSLEEVLLNQSDHSSHNQSVSSRHSHETRSQPISEKSHNKSSASSSWQSKRSVRQSPVAMPRRKVAVETRESPWTPGSIRKTSSMSDEEKQQMEKSVLLWHQLGGTMTSSSLNISEGSRCRDVIEALLTQCHVTDDPNLFYVVDRDSNGREVELEQKEPMAALQRKWAIPAAHKLELRQKSGVQIKVIYKAIGEEDKQEQVKSMRVASSSTCDHVTRVVCLKFSLRPPEDFLLMELRPSTGDVQGISSTRHISELLSDTLLLIRSSEASFARQLASSLRRSDSMNSHDSSNISETSQVTMTREQLELRDQLESQFAEIEAELEKDANLSSAHNAPKIPPAQAKPPLPVPRQTAFNPIQQPKASSVGKGRSANLTPTRRVLSAADEMGTSHLTANSSLELMQEIALLKESIKERDAALLDLKMENADLQLKADQLTGMQLKVAAMGESLDRQEEEHDRQMAALRREIETRAQADDDHADPRTRVRALRAGIDDLQHQITSEESRCRQLRASLEQQASRSRPDVRVVEKLQSELNQSEISIKISREKHSNMVQKLQEAETVAMAAETRDPMIDVYNLIQSDKPPCLHALELEPKNGSYGLMIGRDREKRLVVRHTEDGRPILKGDRLLEVNGRLVAKMEDQEIASFLKNAKQDGGALKLVVLRDNEPMENAVTLKEYEALKDDYSLVMLDLETVENEKKDLAAEVEELKKCVKGLNIENDRVKKTLDELKNQIREVGHLNFNDAAPHKRLQLMLEHLQTTPGMHSPLQRGASRRGLDWFHTIVSGEGLDRVLAYDELDEKIPLYESMKMAPKEEVLQALKDTILETRQQKAYLDKLLGTVIDNAPYLLKAVDRHLGLDDDLLSIKSKTEERC